MADDLYRINLQSVPGSSLYRLIHDFASIDRPIGDRPREGYLLDYKEDADLVGGHGRGPPGTDSAERMVG